MLKIRVKYFIWLLVTSSTVIVNAQHTKQLELDISKQKSAAVYLVETTYPTTGIVLHIPREYSFEGSFLNVNSDTTWLKQDEHMDELSDKKSSNLITFSRAIENFQFYPANIQGRVSFTLIDARIPDKPDTKKQAKKKSAGDCSEPVSVDQSEWRAGLPDPDYTRISNTVRNLIVHHTAGSNTDDNYVQVIRNIYIYHTESRGWSDIGYNYLIAQDGTIFKGRDPAGLEQDNVLGAHFCGSNTGTMGIGIMGDYTDIVPPDTTIQSLVKLLNWKAGKEGLDPTGFFYHPLNELLPTISGHRDGCATQCPGNSLYPILTDIRDSTFQAFQWCGYEVNPGLGIAELENDIRIYQREGKVLIAGERIIHVIAFNTLGQEMNFRQTRLSETLISLQVNVQTSSNVIVHVQTESGFYSQMIFIP